MSNDSSRKGEWYQTFTGREVYPLDMRPEDVDIRDIAHSLALQCRFNGACRVFWSVAEHSLQVMDYLAECRDVRLVPGMLAWALMHDAAEAYFSDVPRPIKRSMPSWSEIEDHIMTAIVARFCLVPLVMPEEVKLADEVLLATEARDLLAPPPRSWGLRAEPWSRDLRLQHEPWRVVERRFLRRAVTLGLVTELEAGL